MMNRNREEIKLTHVPTDLSVTLECRDDRGRRCSPYHLGLWGRAKSLLRAKVWAQAHAEPKRLVRSYVLAPADMARVMQDGRAVMGGAEVVFHLLERGVGLDRVMVDARRDGW